MAGHRYWRIYISATRDGTIPTLTELGLRTTPGGTSVATGGVAAASAEFSGFAPAGNGFDRNFTSAWTAPSGPPHWLRYDFGAGNDQDIVQFEVRNVYHQNHNSIGSSPKDFLFQYSDDATSWTTVLTVTNQTGWNYDETRLYTLAAPAASQRPQVFVCT